MANIVPTTAEGGNATQIAKWVLAVGDIGLPVALAGWPDKTVQVISGTGTCSLEGSNDGGTTWSPINYGGVTPAPFTAKGQGLYILIENPALIRVNTVATAGVTVQLIAR